MVERRQQTKRSKAYPFSGLRVLDFGIGAVGVETGRLFAEYGADVIKVESTANPDFIRAIQPGGMGPPFASSNRSKRSFGVNLKTKQGRKLVLRLVQEADVIVENSAKGVMGRLGLAYDVVRKINPRVIMMSSQLLGSKGLWSGWVGYGPSTHMITGLSYLWNDADTDRPGGTQNIYPDHLIGRLGALLTVAGLIQRERTGAGSHGEIAQFEVPIGMLGDLFLQESLQAGSAVPQGNLSVRGAPWGAYPCRGDDEWCVINVANDGQWERLRAVLGNPSWARRAAYGSARGRLEHRAELDRRLGRWTSSRTSRQVMTLLQRHKIPAGMVQHPRDQTEDPHLAKRGYLRPIDQPPLGRLLLEGPAFYGTRLPKSIIQPAPALGQHTREICTGLFNMPEEEVERLLAAGILEAPEETGTKAE